ncbi:MAG: hypothetical protein NVS3B7_20210 [Candidatus Elarobacter sp.]
MRRAALLLAAVFCAATPASAGIDDEPAGLISPSTSLAKVRALYERSHQREHGRAATVEEDWRLFQDGTVGSYKVNRLGKDIRETTTLGPLSYERGILRGQHWEQNRNGVTFTYSGVHEQRDVVSERAFRDAGNDRDVRLAGESVALSAYVVEVNPASGRHQWLYVDKRTGYVLRRERIERRRRYITTYDDYKLVEGVPEPSRIRQTDSLGNEREQILISRTLDETPAIRDVEVPSSRRVVEFPEKQAVVRLPVRFVNGLAVARVVVARTAYDFLLDSGAAGIVVDPSLVEQQNLELYGRRIGATLGTFPESTTIVPQMSIGGLRMRNVVARVVTVPFRVDQRTHIVGLLGFDFFADTVVHVNVDRNLAEALPPERFRPPADTTGVAIALDDKTPAVRARAGTATGRVVLDTGANRSVFETSFAERGDFAPPGSANTQRVRGMGGFANAEPTRIPMFELGGIATREVTADVSNADLGTEDVDAIIGSDLLRTYDLWFDYRAAAVYLRRSRR